MKTAEILFEDENATAHTVILRENGNIVFSLPASDRAEAEKRVRQWENGEYQFLIN
jgi:hypothetical protein